MFRIVNVRLQQSVLCLFEQRQGDKLSPGENDNIQTQRGTLSEYTYFVHTHTPLPRTSLGSLLGGPWLLGTPWGETRGALGGLGCPLGALKRSLWVPWVALGNPWEAMAGPLGIPGSPRGVLGRPWGSIGGASGDPGAPRSVPRVPRGLPGSPEDPP